MALAPRPGRMLLVLNPSTEFHSLVYLQEHASLNQSPGMKSYLLTLHTSTEHLSTSELVSIMPLNQAGEIRPLGILHF